MTDDMRRFNGGARRGAGRPPTVKACRQVAVRLPEDMAAWVAEQSGLKCGGSDAEFLRSIVREAMELARSRAADRKGQPTP